MSDIKEFLGRAWKTISVCVAIVSAATALNVKIHDVAQKEIATSVRTSVREAMSDLTGRVATLESRSIDHEVSIAVLKTRLEVVK